MKTSTDTDLTLSRSSRFLPSDWRFAVLGALLVFAGLAALGFQLTGFFRADIAALITQGAIYALCVCWVRRREARVPLWFVIAIAIAIRMGPLLASPYFSTDIYRYVWDGRVQGAGINPYLYVPNDPALSALRDTQVWPLINRASYAHTIYPPVAELVFFLATRVSASVLAMKATLGLFECLTGWAILRLLDAEGRQRENLIIYAWCPLAA